jgi:DNA-binding NtrC family response regulator
MPARIVVAHDDPEFLESTVQALRDAGHDVASFADCISTINAFEGAQRSELLITRMIFGPGQQNGVSLARMARMKRPKIKVLFVALPEMEVHAEGLGEFMAAPAAVADVVAKVGEMLAWPPPD